MHRDAAAPNVLRVQWDGVPPGLANALRRGMVQHVPVWALQATSAHVKCNNSVTTNEQLLHCLQYTALRQGAPPPLHTTAAAAWKRCAVPAAIGVVGSSTPQRIAAGFPLHSQVHVTRVTSAQLMVAPAPGGDTPSGAWEWDADGGGVVPTPPTGAVLLPPLPDTDDEACDSDGDTAVEGVPIPPPSPCTLVPHREDALLTRLRQGECVGVRAWAAWGTPWARGSHHTAACAVLHALGGGGAARWRHTFTVESVGQVPPAYIVAAGAGAVAAQCTALSKALRRNCPPTRRGCGVGVWNALTTSRTALRPFLCRRAAGDALRRVWEEWAHAVDSTAPPLVPQHSSPRTVAGPQACLRCGRALGHVYTAVACAPGMGATVGDALDLLGLPGDVPHMLCCRVQAMTTVDPAEPHFVMQRPPAPRGDVLMDRNWAQAEAPTECSTPTVVYDVHRGATVCTNPTKVLHVKDVLTAATQAQLDAFQSE